LHGCDSGQAESALATPGIDVAVIGPGDLATSMGFKGRTDHPDFLALVAAFEAKIRASGVAMGGPAPTPAKTNEMIACGYRFLGIGVDGLLLHRGIAAALEGVNRD
jgi:4-hydroxy-2-oxoheptanedioate aldolase